MSPSPSASVVGPPPLASTVQPAQYTSASVMIVRYLPQNTSEMIAPISGKKYAPNLKSDCHTVACACPKCRCCVMYTARIALMP